MFAFFVQIFLSVLINTIVFVSVVFLVPSLTVEALLFCPILLIFVGVWQVLSFAFFQFCGI